MLLQIPHLLNENQLAEIRKILAKAQFDKTKNAALIAREDKNIKALGEQVLSSLEANPLFISAALPAKVFPILFNKDVAGTHHEPAIDGAIRHIPGSGFRVRCDISAVIFLSNPDEYEGGELVIEDNYGLHKIKLPAGHMIIYPASAVNYVNAVKSGERITANFWIESMIQSDAQRTLLFDLDSTIRNLNGDSANAQSVKHLAGTYHNLLRMWANS
jgi:PKHD-type hydroxylase